MRGTSQTPASFGSVWFLLGFFVKGGAPVQKLLKFRAVYYYEGGHRDTKGTGGVFLRSLVLVSFPEFSWSMDFNLKRI